MEQLREMASNWLASPLLWLVVLNIDWDCLVPHCIMGSRDQWEFPPFFRPQWQSLCSPKCLALKVCKGTVKGSKNVCVSTRTSKEHTIIITVTVRYISLHSLNKSRPRQNNRNSVDDISKHIFLNKNNSIYRLKFRWSLFPMVQLTKRQHSFL